METYPLGMIRGTIMFRRAHSLMSDRLKSSVQTFASITQGGDQQIPLPAVVVVTPSAAALTVPIQRQLAAEMQGNKTIWRAISQEFK